MLYTWVDEWGEQGVDAYTRGMDQSVLVAHVDEISLFSRIPTLSLAASTRGKGRSWLFGLWGPFR